MEIINIDQLSKKGTEFFSYFLYESLTKEEAEAIVHPEGKEMVKDYEIKMSVNGLEIDKPIDFFRRMEEAYDKDLERLRNEFKEEFKRFQKRQSTNNILTKQNKILEKLSLIDSVMQDIKDLKDEINMLK